MWALIVRVKDFLFKAKTVSYSFISYFLKFGIWLWTECIYLYIWNISLLLITCFCSWVLQLLAQVFNVLVVSLCKPIIHKLTLLGGRKLEYYKSIGEPLKFWNIIGDKKKGGVHDFWLKLYGGKNLGRSYIQWSRSGISIVNFEQT